MDTFLEMITTTQSDMNIDDNSPLFPLATVKLALNRSKRKIEALFPWPQLRDAKKTSTVSGQEYYDYPDEWRPDSIWRITINGVRYGNQPDGSPMAYLDYMIFREDDPNSTEKRWASQERRFFISPVPTSNGSNDISLWGIKITDALSADGDITVFSYGMPEINEAIVLEATAILKSKGEEQKVGLMFSAEAKQIAIISYDKIKKESAKYEKSEPFFNVPNFYGRISNSTKIGDFD